MRYFEAITEKFDLSAFNMDTFDSFRSSLQRPEAKAKLPELQAELDKINAELSRGKDGLTELFHGTPNHIAQLIKTDGFKLSKGQRQGFMGSINEVENQGIFLTDSKRLANYFGSNRSKYGNDYTVMTVYTDTSNYMETGNAPLDVRKLGLLYLEKWDGKKRRTIPIKEWWWLLDKPEFVAKIKSHGYNGIKFKEDRIVIKDADAFDSHTYMAFDPASIRFAEEFQMNIKQFYEWLKEHHT